MLNLDEKVLSLSSGSLESSLVGGLQKARIKCSKWLEIVFSPMEERKF